MCIDAASSATSSTQTPPPGHIDELERTRSQQAASVKLESVKSHVDKITEPVEDLRRSVSVLAKRTASPDFELGALKEELDAIDQARKRARNFGEDLVEDMLVLDSLGNLIPADRSTRKAAIAGIESLFDNVDSTKARLNTLQRSLESKVGAAEAEAPKVEVASSVGGPVLAPAPTSAPCASAPASSAVEVLQPLGRDAWSQLRLPVRFRSQEEQRCYVIRAAVPDLDTDDIKLSVSDDKASLTVAGLRLPSDDEAKFLYEQLNSRLRQLASSGSHKFTERRLREVAESAYLEMGQNRYGSFTETFRLPGDADVAGIEASYQDGVLRIVVPKLVARGGGFGRRFVSPRPSGSTSYYPSLGGARYAGGSAMPPFGGLGASFW